MACGYPVTGEAAQPTAQHWLAPTQVTPSSAALTGDSRGNCRGPVSHGVLARAWAADALGEALGDALEDGLEDASGGAIAAGLGEATAGWLVAMALAWPVGP
jgi:hypothetical protein